jgi:lysophospholipase L1-like esterase
MMRRTVLAAGVLGILLSTSADAADAQRGSHWVATWGTAQMAPSTQDEIPAAQWRDGTLRQIVHLSAGGSTLRVRFSNVFGTQPLTINAASVALAAGPGKPDADAASMHALRFQGSGSVLIPAGAEYLSDPVELHIAGGADIAISMRLNDASARQTSHPGARANSFLTMGDHVMDAQWGQADKTEHWYLIADVDVLAAPRAHSVVAIGDSITDGHGATTDGNDRWPDLLAARLRGSGMGDVGVVNAGIGGGRLLRDGIGPNLVARFDRDVLGRAGATHAIVMIGVNDLGVLHRDQQDDAAGRTHMLDDLERAQRQLVERAHEKGVCVIGGTITPFVANNYYKAGPDNEHDRQAYNKWMRESGVFDAVADFDAALRDPAQPELFAKQYDSGDGLHPSPAGFRAMAQAVPLASLKTCRFSAHGGR